MGSAVIGFTGVSGQELARLPELGLSHDFDEEDSLFDGEVNELLMQGNGWGEIPQLNQTFTVTRLDEQMQTPRDILKTAVTLNNSDALSESFFRKLCLVRCHVDCECQKLINEILAKCRPDIFEQLDACPVN